MSSRRHCEPLIAFGASVAEDGAGDGDFRVIDIERVIGIIDGQAHLCTA